MSNLIKKKLPLANIRQQNYIRDAAEFIKSNGIYTKARFQFAFNLISKIENNINEYRRVDAEWLLFISTITDAEEKTDEELIYSTHALESGDPRKIPYFERIQQLEEASSDLETEVKMIQLNDENPNSSIVSDIHPTSPPPQAAPATSIIVMQQSETQKRLFNGSPMEFKSFFDDFNATINPKDSPGRKLAFLKQRLTSDALDAVKQFEGDAGYDPALLKLKTRFGNAEDAINELRKKIHFPFRMKNDLKELRKVFDQFEYLLTTLGQYGENIESNEWVGCLNKKLPEKVLERVADSKRMSKEPDKFDVSELRRTVDSIILDFERIEKITGKNDKVVKFEKFKPNKPFERKVVMTNTTEKTNFQNASKKPQVAKRPQNCGLCEGLHATDDCTLPKSIEEVKQIAYDKRLCFKCFGNNHASKKCTKKLTCKKCGGRHHVFYCQGSDDKETRRAEKHASAVVSFPVNPVCAMKMVENETMLLTCEAWVSNPSNPMMKEKILIFVDPGSMINLINEDLAKTLNLLKIEKHVCCQGADGNLFTPNGLYEVALHLESGELRRLTAYGNANMVNNIAVPKVSLDKLINDKSLWNKPLPVKIDTPKLLLSIKEFTFLVLGQKTENLQNGFSIIYSKLGPMICGEGNITYANIRPISPLAATIIAKAVNETIVQDEAKVLDETKIVEDAKVVEETLVLDEAKAAEESEIGETENVFSYQVQKTCTDDKSVNILKDINMEDLQEKDPEYGRRYQKCVYEFRDSSFTREILLILIEKGHLMPHSLVHTPGKTTPDRLVFNGSSKTERGISLNGCLLTGENRVPLLAGIMMRSRTYPVITCSDVKKAFLKVHLNEKSRKYVRFLFLRDISKPATMDNLVLYEFLVVPFGLGCSTNLLYYAIEFHLDNTAIKDPEHASWLEETKSNTYIDNANLGSKDAKDAIEKNVYVKEVFAKANMDLRGQISNDSIVNEYFGATDLSFNLLGHELIIETDSFIVGWKKFKPENVPKTKQALLSFCASLFDLMGLIEPVRLPIKLKIRKCWSLKVDWKSLLNAELIEEIKELYEERCSFSVLVKRLAINRYTCSKMQLHIFGDASGQAYGVAAYLRYLDEDNAIKTALIFSKSRLAPLKPVMTIAKLELTATALANLVMDFLLKELKEVLEFEKCFIHTDSTTVLYWIKNCEGKGRFVNNRVQKLRNSIAEFRFVPGIENPADLVSRGCTPDEFLEKDKFWFDGPTFLRLPEDKWPQQPNLEEGKEVTETLIVAAITAKPSEKIIIAQKVPFVDAKHFSSWRRLVKGTSYVMKFCMMKSPQFFEKVFNKKVMNGFERRKVAEKLLLTQMQHAKDVKEDLAIKMDIYCDNGTWKKYSRIKKLDDPIFLANCATTRLLILDIHINLNHASTSMVLAEFNQKFFMQKARSTIKKVIRSRCMECRQIKSVPFAHPLMNDLKENRTHGKPFHSIGVDLCGGFKLKDEIGQHWIAVFTCFTTRCVHLEVLPSLSGDAFIDALSRFAARRGMPCFIYSDNATNFKITAATVIPLWFEKKDENVLQWCSSKRIHWKFNIEKAPWAGGVFEAMVKLVKRNLKVAVGKKQPTFWKFLTLTHQIEAWVNSRPLTYIAQGNDQIVLRPIDFLVPFAKPGVPEFESDDNDPTFIAQANNPHNELVNLWKGSQKILIKFKETFNKEYLAMLRERTRSHQQGSVINRNPRIGEIVTIFDEAQDKAFWKMGKVVELIQSSDNRIRAAKVLTPNGRILKRPVSHLYPLEIDPESMKNPSQPVRAKKLLKLQLQESDAYAHEDTKPIEIQDKEDEEEDEVEKVLPPKTHHMKTRPARNHGGANYGVSSMIKFNKFTLMIFCFLLAIACNEAKMCPSDKQLDLVYQNSCTQSGYKVLKHEETYCWRSLKCLKNGWLSLNETSDFSCEATNPCICPPWAQDCSHLLGEKRVGNSTIANSNVKHLFDAEKPGYCSLEPSKKCSSQHHKKNFMQIQLMDESLHFVNDLNLVHNEAHDESFRCFGESKDNAVDGTPEYCQIEHHLCDDTSNKICVPTFIEKTFLTTSHGTVEIKAWGLVQVMVYDALEDLNLNWTTECKTGILIAENIEVNDILEIKYPQMKDYVKVIEKKMKI